MGRWVGGGGVVEIMIHKRDVIWGGHASRWFGGQCVEWREIGHKVINLVHDEKKNAR